MLWLSVDIGFWQVDRMMSIGFWGVFCFLFFNYFSLRWVFVAAPGLSLVAASGGLLFIAMHGLLIAGASLVAEHGL